MEKTSSIKKGRLNKTAKRLAKLYRNASGTPFIKWSDGQDIMLEFHASPRTLYNWRKKI